MGKRVDEELDARRLQNRQSYMRKVSFYVPGSIFTMPGVRYPEQQVSAAVPVLSVEGAPQN